MYPTWQWKVNYNPINKLYPIIKEVSGLYAEEESASPEPINNLNFQRKSLKFWVPSDKIIPVICHILPHLPIYIWDEDINEHIYQKVSSVYLDNHELDMYHNRINKIEGNQLVRIRWYGDQMDSVFMERKEHHEDWTGKKSVKARFELSSRNILSYLRNDINLEGELQNQIQQTITEKVSCSITKSLDINFSIHSGGFSI